MSDRPVGSKQVAIQITEDGVRRTHPEKQARRASERFEVPSRHGRQPTLKNWQHASLAARPSEQPRSHGAHRALSGASPAPWEPRGCRLDLGWVEAPGAGTSKIHSKDSQCTAPSGQGLRHSRAPYLVMCSNVNDRPRESFMKVPAVRPAYPSAPGARYGSVLRGSLRPPSGGCTSKRRQVVTEAATGAAGRLLRRDLVADTCGCRRRARARRQAPARRGR